MQLVSVLNRLAIFGALWVVLTGGGVDSLAYGAAAVAVATVLSLLIYPVDRPGVVVWRAAAILPRFLVHSGLGGLDVARRAFDPTCRFRQVGSTSPCRAGMTRPMFCWGG